MKFWTKILFTGIIVLALIFTAIYLFLVFQGRALIVKQLEDLTKRKVNIGYFGIGVPFNIEMKKIDIEGLARVDSVTISPSIIGFLIGNIVLNDIRIIKPEFTYEKSISKIVESSFNLHSTVTTTSPPQVTVKPEKKRPLRLIFRRINIKDGRLNFIDHSVSKEVVKIVIKDINFNLVNLYAFPSLVVTNFELRGKIPWREGREEGKIEAKGWLNLFKKDIQATLKIEDIDGIYLYPYYSNWVNLEKARIEKANLNFTSNIQGLNNDVTAECRLELTEVVRKPLQPEESEEKAAKITDTVLDIFKTLNQDRIVLDFNIKTKMDRPEFSFTNIKMAFEDKLAQAKKTRGFRVENVLMLPGNVLQRAIKGATDLSKAVVDGTFSVAKELKKVVEDTFKK